MSSVHICVCDCTSGYKTNRFDIPLNKLTEKADSLLAEICKEIGSKENEFETVYCGQKVDSGMSLGPLHLTSQSTLYVFRKPAPACPSPDFSSLQMASELMPLIHKAIMRPSYKKTVDHILTSADHLHGLLKAAPGLDKDPTTMAMLQDPELLQLLTHRNSIHKVLKMHPLFGPAAMHIAKIVDDEHARDPFRSQRSNNVYSLDQMSDEEDEGAQAPRNTPAPPVQITASQVAAALAAATASAAAAAQASAPGSSTGATAGSSSGGSTPGLFPDFVQQRMMSAQNSALEAQLQQLREMGITNENVARQALQATNGDLHAALEIIFAEDSM